MRNGDHDHFFFSVDWGTKMELLFLTLLFGFYLFSGYSAAVLGFVVALLSLSQGYLGRIVYWFLWLLFHVTLLFMLFSPIHWIPYIFGSLVGYAYLPSYTDGSERTGKRASRWFRRLRIWQLLHWWMNFNVIDPETDEHKDIRLYAIHPHGFLPVSAALAFSIPGQFGEIELSGRPDPLLALTGVLFWIPFLRDIFLWAGCVDAIEEVMIEVLKTRSLVVAPGGIREGMLHDHNTLRLYFGHQGFLRAATKANVRVVPVFARGENRIWVALHVPGWEWIRQACTKRFRYPFPMLFVPFLFPHDLTLFIGKSLDPLTGNFEERMCELVRNSEPSEDISLDDFNR